MSSWLLLSQWSQNIQGKFPPRKCAQKRKKGNKTAIDNKLRFPNQRINTEIRNVFVFGLLWVFFLNVDPFKTDYTFPGE